MINNTFYSIAEILKTNGSYSLCFSNNPTETVISVNNGKAAYQDGTIMSAEDILNAEILEEDYCITYKKLN